MQVILEMEEYLNLKAHLIKLVEHAKAHGADARTLNDTRQLFTKLHIKWPKDALNIKDDTKQDTAIITKPQKIDVGPNPAEIDAAAEDRRTNHHA